MTVKELIEVLSGIENKKRIVLLSSDEEGNGYSELAAINTDYKCKRDGYTYEIGLEKLSKELEDQGYSQDDVMKKGKPCVILWP